MFFEKTAVCKSIDVSVLDYTFLGSTSDGLIGTWSNTHDLYQFPCLYGAHLYDMARAAMVAGGLEW